MSIDAFTTTVSTVQVTGLMRRIYADGVVTTGGPASGTIYSVIVNRPEV